MRLVKPSVEFIWATPAILKTIELVARNCYKTEEKITDTSAVEMVKMLLARKHWHMFRHASMSYRLVCDRGISHELVRHGLAAFAQESTRYCNYAGGVTFVIPPWISIREGEVDADVIDRIVDDPTRDWAWFMTYSEQTYQRLLERGWNPQKARSVLPNSLKTEVIITTTITHWAKHIFPERLSPAAHPQMREVMEMVVRDAAARIPVIFDEFVKGLENGGAHGA